MSKKIRVALIGCGGIAEMAHMPGYDAFPEKCEVLIACDSNPETAKKFAGKFGIGKIETDWKKIAESKEIDAVSITTPNAFHKEPAIGCLASGKHVLCEKPLALNGTEAREICLAAKKSGKILQVGLNQRFTPSAKFLKSFIEKGHMGEIQYARAQAIRRRGVPHWGVFIDKEKQGGGPLIDIGVHILDLTLHLMGYPKPILASGKTWDSLGKNPALTNFFGPYDREKFTVEDFATGQIRFENGSIVTLESSFMANAEGDPFTTQLYGTEAGAIWKPSECKIFKEMDEQYFEMNPVNYPKSASSYVEEVGAFLNAIETDGPSPVPGEHAMYLNAIFDAIYESSATGHEVPVITSY